MGWVVVNIPFGMMALTDRRVPFERDTLYQAVTQSEDAFTVSASGTPLPPRVFAQNLQDIEVRSGLRFVEIVKYSKYRD